MSGSVEMPTPPRFLIDSLFGTEDDLEDVCLYHGPNTSEIRTPTGPDDSKPFVTLTFAQSLDAKIAGRNGKQLILSGKESLVMTHWMRTMHDGIMVGVGTALNDNPQLNTRHLPPLPPNAPHKYHLPRPIIFDPNLRLADAVGSKLLSNFREGKGRRPWIVTYPPEEMPGLQTWGLKSSALQGSGWKIIEVSRENGLVSIPEMLKALKEHGIRSLMVEGGARVIQSFLAESQSSSRAVDRVIVTVAPTFMGADGVGYGANLTGTETHSLVPIATEVFGRDAVLSMKFS